MQLQAVAKSADEQNFDKMKAAYDACLDEDEIKNVGVKPLVEVLDAIKKVYPVNISAGSNEHALKDAILLLAKYGISSLVSAGTGADDTDPDTVIVAVSAPYNFGLPSKERYEDEKLVEKYRNVAVEVLSALYPDESKESFSKIIDLEKKLAAASPSSEERDDVTVCIFYGRYAYLMSLRPTSSMNLIATGTRGSDMYIFADDLFTEILQPNADRRGGCYCTRN
jgi:endothelin-converting enzyme